MSRPARYEDQFCRQDHNRWPDLKQISMGAKSEETRANNLAMSDSVRIASPIQRQVDEYTGAERTNVWLKGRSCNRSIW